MLYQIFQPFIIFINVFWVIMLFSLTIGTGVALGKLAKDAVLERLRGPLNRDL